MLTEAAIDIGTNTMLILVAKIGVAAKPGALETKPGALRTIETVLNDQIQFVRLGEGVHQNRRFSDAAMERAIKVFREFRAVCDRHGATTIRACATSASRDAANSRDFYARVKAETGIDVMVIEGKTEARLSFLGGLLPFQDSRDAAVLDIGGGSTEFVVLDNDGSGVRGQSIDMGCVRGTEMFLKGDPYDPATIVALENHLRGMWKTLDPELQAELRQKQWTGIAGTPTTLAGIILGMKTFDAEALDGYRMKRTEIEKLHRALASQTQAVRAANPLMGTGRADIIVAGVAILLTAMDHFGKTEIVVSSRGLRHGILLDPPLLPA